MVEVKGKGDKYGLPIIYDGIEMRSKMEARTAYVLDQLDIDWEYEPQSFFLQNGMTYIPDFYLPDLDTWIEVKGVMEDKDKKQIKLFNKEGKEIIVIMEDNLKFYGDNGNKYPNQPLYIGKCDNCGFYFFCGKYGSYHCRSCGTHNGDHDLKYYADWDLHGLTDLEKVVEDEK